MPEIKKMITHENIVNKEEVESVRIMIEDYLKSARSRYNIGSGSIAEVYRADIGQGEYCVKRKEHSSGKEIFEKRIEEEMELQAQAFLIVEEREKQNKPVAKVPKPLCYVETDDGQEMIIMERIKGKTLFRLMIEEIAQTIPEDKLSEFLPGVRKEEIPDLSDRDMNELVIDGFMGAREKRKRMSKAELDNHLRDQILRRFRTKKLLPKQIMHQIANTLDAWKKNNFFHRDLHENNLMISDDLSQAYIIDYGASSYNEYASAKDAYEIEKMGQQYLFFRDEGIFNILDQVIEQ